MKSYVPADFHEHECSVLLWPYGVEYWRLNSEPIQAFYEEYIRAIAQFEPLKVGVVASELERVTKRFENISEKYDIEFFEMEYDDVYVRDTTPTVYFENGQKFVVEWSFNGWGGAEKGICSTWDKDNSVSSQISEKFKLKSIISEYICEGGGLLFDGLDTLILVKNTILNNNRNKFVSEREMTQHFKSILPIKHVIWINSGLANDETDGHIDNVCAFKNPNEILLAWTDNPLSSQYEIVRNAESIIKNNYELMERPLTIHKIPIPNVKARTDTECEGIEIENVSYERFKNEILLGSYLNFIFVNDGILLPRYDCEEDSIAIQTFTDIFPSRKIYTLNSRELILGGGSLHCSSYHIPKYQEE